MVDKSLTAERDRDEHESQAHVPTQAQRERVSLMAEAGVGQRGIAGEIGIAVNTLRKHYMRELVRADAKMQVIIGQATLQEALGHAAQYDDRGNVIRAEIKRNPMLLKFLCCARLGFRDGGPGQIDPNGGPPDDGLEYNTVGLTDSERTQRVVGIFDLARARRDRRAADGADQVGAVPEQPAVKGAGEHG